ncbi:MAG: hypothetical protein LBG57_03035 [Treponema sp.]|jgi:hypothetical protein|nr:hypothetical protein [Treponema sp.]
MKSVEEVARISGMSIFRVRIWAREHGMKRMSGKYFFDEAQEAAFLNRRTLEGDPRSGRTMAKKYRCSVQKAAQWARKNGVQKRGNSYYFTLEDEAKFEKVKDVRMGRPSKEKSEVKEPKRPRGRPRKDGINGSL